MKVTNEHHYYPTDERIIIVSKEALQDKRANWIEIPGVAAGYAYVTHPDWIAITEHYKMVKGESRLIGVKLEDGTLVHFGSINISYNENKIYLNG